MKIRKNLAVAAAVATVGIASLSGIGVAAAQSNGSGSDSLIDKIATKFNLNKDDVKSVFDEYKSEKQAEHQAELSDRLQKAVDDGKITADQKTLIENKVKELQDKREAERTALQDWASQNNIDMKYVLGGHHGQNDQRLQDAVDNGEITADQKTLIENKQKELEDARDSLQDELQQWAKDNDIDTKYLMFGHMSGGPGGRGHGGPHGPGDGDF